MKTKALFSSYYFAPIEYFFYLTQYNTIYKDIHENFVKQTYRNRCYILSPNGVQNLTIPLVKVRKKKIIKEVKIAFDENWQKIHWKSFEAAYRRSPFFEFYEDVFYSLFHNKQTFLIDFNELLEQKIIELIGLNLSTKITDSYQKDIEKMDDYRSSFSPKEKLTNLNYPQYIQVFSDRNPFQPNLSIVDLLFNEGPNSLNYLKSISTS